jgi:hypothetical protein
MIVAGATGLALESTGGESSGTTDDVLDSSEE